MLRGIGIELHQVSLAGLIVVLGLVVDDAIVIADNYVEYLDQGVSRDDAALRSASGLAVPVFAATLTIAAATSATAQMVGRSRSPGVMPSSAGRLRSSSTRTATTSTMITNSAPRTCRRTSSSTDTPTFVRCSSVLHQ